MRATSFLGLQPEQNGRPLTTNPGQQWLKFATNCLDLQAEKDGRPLTTEPEQSWLKYAMVRRGLKGRTNLMVLEGVQVLALEDEAARVGVLEDETDRMVLVVEVYAKRRSSRTTKYA